MRFGVLLTCLLFATGAVGEDELLRYVEFRDGSLMRLAVVDEAWSITLIRADGQVEQTSARLAQLENLVFTREKGFARKQTLLSAVRRLGAEDFHDRERAQAELQKLGPGIRADLESCLGFCHDTEARIRLAAILRTLPAAAEPTAPTAVFDRFRLGEECWGHLGDHGVPVRVEGKVCRLSREDVAGVSRTPPAYYWSEAGRPGAVVFERLALSDFPAGCIEEPFERTSGGRPLMVGENIQRAFIDKGFLLSTSIAYSHVSVNAFKVEGKSGGLSIATHQPQWEGVITIRFVQPGREQAPAGVHYFGCNIAAVVPNGTYLVAFDRQGRELGRIGTQTHGNDFLGVRSSTPIHRIQIIPFPQLDRDYTLDDFIFSPPHDPDSRHEKKFIVRTTDGSRFACADAAFESAGVRLIGMPGGLPDWRVPLNEVSHILFPGTTPAAEDGIFAELPDGSLLRGQLDGNGPPTFPRLNAAATEKNVRALWNGTRPPAPPADKDYVWDAEQNRWHEITEPRFLEEIVIWKRAGEFHAAPYRRLTALHLAGAPAMPGRWRVATESGDELVLHDLETQARLAQGLSASWRGRPLRLAAGDVRFLQLAR